MHRPRLFGGMALGIALASLNACAGAADDKSTAVGARSVSGDSTYDLVIENGKVVDGTGNPWFYGDIAIRGDRVVRIVRCGMLANASARRRLDATGKVVAPGFIDIQAGGPYLTGDGRDVSKLTQGVTTEIMGEGYASAPISDLTLTDLQASGSEAVASAKQFQGPRGFDTWLRAMEAHGVLPNIGAFVGASTEELIEVAKAMAPYGGLSITHMRSEADQVLEGMDEALRIGTEAGVAKGAGPNSGRGSLSH